MTEVNCYNTGCGKKFDPDKNADEDCEYHPGTPIFHDAYKQWSCCKKKSTDFTTWLSYKGCAKGRHSNKKPAEIPKPVTSTVIRPEKEEEVIVWPGLNKPAKRERTDVCEFCVLPVEMTVEASAALQQYREAELQKQVDDGSITVGTSCKHSSCTASYNGPETDAIPCVYHPGVAIFHEGMKYWSCCKRKTSDFNAFLNQAGCERGKHKWKEAKRIADKIRQDWFTRGEYIHVNVYCRGVVGEDSVFQSDGLKLKTKIVHGFGEKVSEAEYDLFGEISPAESRVIVAPRKIEIILKKHENMGWPTLTYEAKEESTSVEA